MASFNASRRNSNKVLNHEGEVSYKLNALEKLYSRVLGGFFGESTFYEKREAKEELINLKNLVSLVNKKDLEYVLKIAELGRKIGMRSFPINLYAVAMNDNRFKGAGSKLFKYVDILQRAKDLNDLLAVHFALSDLKLNERVLPKQMRKALKYKLETFNEYQLSKGLEERSEVKLKDVVKLIHPNPENNKNLKNKNFYKDIIESKVKVGGDDNLVSCLANKDYDNLITCIRKASYLPLLMNLIAVLKVSQDCSVIELLIEKLTNEKAILKSQVLPFRFYNAYLKLKEFATNLYSDSKVNMIMQAVEKALDISINNLDDLEGFNCVVIDVSASMDRAVSSKSSTTALDIAVLLGAIVLKKGRGNAYVFSSEYKFFNHKNIDRRKTVLQLVNELKSCGINNCGTYFYKVMTDMLKRFIKYDKMIFLSDGDCYNRDFYSKEYYFETSFNNKITPEDVLRNGVVDKIYYNNLLGNEFTYCNMRDKRIKLVTGFSERIIDFISIVDKYEEKDIRKVIDLSLKKLDK